MKGYRERDGWKVKKERERGKEKEKDTERKKGKQTGFKKMKVGN